MAAKNFAASLRRDPHDTTKPVETVAPAVTNTDEPKKAKKGKKTGKPVGRPKVKEGEYKTINISVPVEMLEKMDVAKLKYSNNLTAYVNAVIEADLNANFEKYKKLQEILNG